MGCLKGCRTDQTRTGLGGVSARGEYNATAVFRLLCRHAGARNVVRTGGVVIGGLIIAMYLPILSMGDAVGGAGGH